ncbi:hypothetical protein PpBr36_08493 [Pyricularia pennisetigena]|uniref:hypothetical protein n=1 Tax=Pyricularia pennisetigena TaxID=1578925 RepID=UPI001154D68E|nr:hypothetical protein PpBr36_08493 [Pyricularia pennisetigena]TLS24358.1 hypothetical protein PpBr36_08493 [Pyricularia pennisetigena]
MMNTLTDLLDDEPAISHHVKELEVPLPQPRPVAGEEDVGPAVPRALEGPLDGRGDVLVLRVAEQQIRHDENVDAVTRRRRRRRPGHLGQDGVDLLAPDVAIDDDLFGARARQQLALVDVAAQRDQHVRVRVVGGDDAGGAEVRGHEAGDAGAGADLEHRLAGHQGRVREEVIRQHAAAVPDVVRVHDAVSDQVQRQHGAVGERVRLGARWRRRRVVALRDREHVARREVFFLILVGPQSSACCLVGIVGLLEQSDYGDVTELFLSLERCNLEQEQITNELSAKLLNKFTGGSSRAT